MKTTSRILTGAASRRSLASAVLGSLFLAVAGTAGAAEEENWISLFNGKDLEGWQRADGSAASWAIEDGALIRREEKSGDLWTRQRFGDFVLELEFKTEGNSGVFIRTSDPRDNVQTGIEIQVDRPRDPGKHSVGALYDLVPPAKSAARDGDWNALRVEARGSRITVHLNGEAVTEMDLDRWMEAGKNPDGSANKFKRPLKDFAREGHIGLQDHGARVAYRNLRIRKLG